MYDFIKTLRHFGKLYLKNSSNAGTVTANVIENITENDVAQ